MRFEALQAQSGDCLFLTFDGIGRKHCIIVDGGPSAASAKVLDNRINVEREAQGLEKGEELIVDAVMVSHIDDDHVVGLNRLFAELNDRRQKRQPWGWRPRWLLHNTFDEIAGEANGGVAAVVGGETVLASLSTSAFSFLTNEIDEDALRILQSYPNGRALSTLAASLEVSRNPPSRGALQLVEENLRVLKVGRASLTIVGPLEPQVDEFRRQWEKFKAGDETSRRFPGVKKGLDDSITNLSSIVVLMELGDRRLLLTGDAQGPLILEGLERAKFLPKGGVLDVDVLKLPHHGSDKNSDSSFFKRIRARHYVVSGDGNHGNPDRRTLEQLEAAITKPATLHMTYSAAHCDARHKQYLGAKPFDAATQGIESLLADWKKKGSLLEVVEGGVGINL